MTSRRSMLVFVVAALVLLAAMGWVTVRALRLERDEAAGRAENQRQEAVRLALWRLDSTISAFLAQEAARPFFHYQAFYPADRSYGKMLEELGPDEPALPSPLLAGGEVSAFPDAVKLYFHQWPDGRLTSPEAPVEPLRARAADYLWHQSVPPARVDLAASRLADLVVLMAPERTVLRAEPAPQPVAPAEPAPSAIVQQSDAVQWTREQQQEFVNRRENDARSQVAKQARQTYDPSNIPPQYRNKETKVEQQSAGPPPAAVAPDAPGTPANERVTGRPAAAETLRDEAPDRKLKDVGGETGTPTPAVAGVPMGSGAPVTRGYIEVPAPIVGEIRPAWIASARGRELLLIRTVAYQGDSHQGLWIDWPKLRQQLIERVADITPGATLVEIDPADQPPDALATIPARLSWTPPVAMAQAGLSPTRLTLAVGWITVLSVLTAIGLLVRQAVELSERRGKFVSAVTHELRTPLTTFCLYSQMLADGMVKDDVARQSYYDTLKSESGRLARIVESVLDYARLGKRAPNDRLGSYSAREVVLGALPALSARAAQGEFQIVSDLDAAVGVSVRADPQAIERILYNLVENSCKYAGEAADRRLHLAASVRGKHVVIRFADHGPGIDDEDARTLFAPFQRGKNHQSHSTPGLGLGLALARGLARDMGGDLRLVHGSSATEGAVFELIIPTAAGPA